MSWRNGYFWALGAFVALVLCFSCHPGLAGDAFAGLSAPSAPTASFESAPVATLLQSHFEWGGPALRSASITLSLAAIHVHAGTRLGAEIAPHYGPLHRRPPPSST